MAGLMQGGEGSDLRDTEQQSLQDSVWVRGLRERVLIMTPRPLAWVSEWMTLPCTGVRGYSDFPSGPFWFAVSGTPKGKSHLKLDMFVWE